jgi:pimeloyl-ACP methyl ester carboxylesterase
MSLSRTLALAFIRTKFRLLSAWSKRRGAEAAFKLFTTPQYRNQKELTPLFEEAEAISFNFQDYQIQGYRWNSGAPRTALLLHGFESSIVNFEQYVQPLVDRGFCVIGFDAPAHGRSSGDQMNVRIYMDFIEEIRERFGPVQAFLGHSLGGLSLSLALEEQGHTENARMVLIAPATETRTAIDYYFNFVKLSKTLRPAFDQFITEKGGREPSWFSVVRAVGNLRLPILWVHDTEDDMTPTTDVVPAQKAAHAHVEFLITTGLGHRRIYRDPGVVIKVVAFLAHPQPFPKGGE